MHDRFDIILLVAETRRSRYEERCICISVGKKNSTQSIVVLLEGIQI